MSWATLNKKTLLQKLLLTVLAVTFVFSSVFTPFTSAFAAPVGKAYTDVQYDVQAIVKQKILFNAMVRCFKEGHVYPLLNDQLSEMPKQYELFGTVNGGYRKDTTKAYGSYLEWAVQQKYDDGAVWCGTDKNNKLVETAFAALGLDWAQFICGVSGAGGLLKRNNGSDCVQGEGKFKVNDKDYFYTYLKEIGGITASKTGYKAGNYLDYTDAELYWVYRLMWQGNCTTGAEASGENWTIDEPVLNPTTNEYELQQVKFGKKKGGGSALATDARKGFDGEEGAPAKKNNAESNCDTIAAHLTKDDSLGLVNALLEFDNTIPEDKRGGIETESSDGSSEENKSYCQAGDFGWAMCPVAKTLGGLIDIFWGFVEDLISIKPALLTNSRVTELIEKDAACATGTGAATPDQCQSAQTYCTWAHENNLTAIIDTCDDPGGAYGAWGTFRDIANVIFVILLIIVVFSQVTGFGINNYGIKKILPKLVIVALLINLSFIICQIAVDLSNIIGSQVKSLLANMNIPASDPPEDFTSVLEGILNGALLMTGGVAAAFIATGGGVAGILLLLVAAAIAVFMMFLILAVRQAAVILLVVVSPIAFACYLLPNTEAVFKKWKSIFWTMLVLYPICGLTIGASTLAMNIIMASTTPEDWFLRFLAQMLPILPAFIIPSLVKNTMNAFGTLGAKLNGIGGRVTGAAQNRVKSSRIGVAAQESDKQRAINRAKIRAGIGNSRRARFNKFLNERTGRSGQRFAAVGISTQDKQEKEDMQDDMTMVLKATKNAGDLTAMKRLYDEARDSGNENRLRAIAETMGSQKFRAKDFSKWVKADSTAGTLGGSSLEAVAKQMTTGDGSKNYRAADALGYEYATKVVGDSAAATGTYDAWSSSAAHISKAFDNHITNGSELYSQSADVIDEVRTKGDPATQAKLAQLAVRAQTEASQTGEYDQTKETALDAAIATSPNAMVIDQSYARSRTNPNTVVTVEHLHNGKVRVKGTTAEQNEDSFWIAHDKI